MPSYAAKVGATFCSSPHPDNGTGMFTNEYEGIGTLYCRKFPEHDGPHAAYGLEISRPLEW